MTDVAISPRQAQTLGERLAAQLDRIADTTVRGGGRRGAPNVPVILSSGASPEAMARMFRAHPYDVFLQKPYTLDELRRAFAQAAAAVPA